MGPALHTTLKAGAHSSDPFQEGKGLCQGPISNAVILTARNVRQQLDTHRGPKDRINMRILQTIVSGIPPFFVLGLRTRA